MPRSLAGLVVTAILVAFSFTHGTLADDSTVGNGRLFERLDANADGRISAAEVAPEHKRLFDRLLRRSDTDGDRALDRGEFLEGLVPSRPPKPIESKQPSVLPEAAAVRYVLLSIDTNADRLIEADEVPNEFREVFATLLDRLDRNENGSLEPNELSRGAPVLSRVAGRYVSGRQINAAAEVKKLELAQGKSAERFDGRRMPVEMLGDPRQARLLFARLDANGDGRIEQGEVPEPFQPQWERFLKLGDGDDDARLTEREFLRGAARAARRLARPGKPF